MPEIASKSSLKKKSPKKMYIPQTILAKKTQGRGSDNRKSKGLNLVNHIIAA